MASAMFDWNDLKYFLAVARHGSTVSAAKALNVNRSTVHRRLDALEKKLGRRLFSRQPTGYELTELGQKWWLTRSMWKRVREYSNSGYRHLTSSLGSARAMSGPVTVFCGNLLLRSLFGVKRTWFCAMQTSADF